MEKILTGLVVGVAVIAAGVVVMAVATARLADGWTGAVFPPKKQD